MIYAIAAIDSRNGVANNNGIPWQGKLPSDLKHFREKTRHAIVVMGYATYQEFEQPLSDRRNFVATNKKTKLRPGFEAVRNIKSFLQNTKENVWIIGGAGLFASTLYLIDELDLTLIDQDFECTKFFPDFRRDFVLVDEGLPFIENNIEFRFTRWKRK